MTLQQQCSYLKINVQTEAVKPLRFQFESKPSAFDMRALQIKKSKGLSARVRTETYYSTKIKGYLTNNSGEAFNDIRNSAAFHVKQRNG